MRRFCSYGLIFLMLCFGACSDSFEFSPNQVFDQDSAINLNAKNLARLDTMPGDDTVTFAFVGDSQRFYDELERFIDTVNTIEEIDFVLLAGDISDFGLLEEFELVHEQLSGLNKPYFGVVGNHDVVARGEEIFERMFGPLNYAFTYRSIKFVAHNTNGKEYPDEAVPDMNWLRSALVTDDAARNLVAVSHVPPFSSDFNEDLEHEYTALLSETPALLLSLHGHVHTHQDGYPYNDGVRYMTSHSFDKKRFVMLKIHSGRVVKTEIEY